MDDERLKQGGHRYFREVRVYEIAFPYNTRKVSQSEQFEIAIKNCRKRLTYKQLINENKKAA